MCGILGWISGGGARPSRETFESALAEIAHRGPDDWGIEVFPEGMLGHRRLSIIDLSASGHQPKFSRSLKECVAFNGEVYNYIELRAQLGAAGTALHGGDTELLVEMIERFGVDALPKFNGMWAFASWNAERRRLLISRDRFGVKPLYYVLDKRGLVFGSEPKAILKLCPDLRAANVDVLADFLVDNQLHAGAQSFYNGLNCLAPGHWLEFEPATGRVRQGSIWQYPTAQFEGRSDEDLCEEFSALLSDAVKIRLRSDVPVGLTLSGGLDSSALLAASHHLGTNLNAYTSVYDERGVDELTWAQLVSDRFGNELVPVVAKHEDWEKGLHDIAWHMDSPGYSPAVFPLWGLMRAIRSQGIKVILEGQGADELLAGYPQYAALQMALQLKSGRLSELRKFVRCFQASRASVGVAWSAAWTLRESFPIAHKLHRRINGLHGILVEPLRQRALARAEAGHAQRDTLSTRLQHDHGSQILPGLLHYGDAMSMANGVESRNPFLDYRLVDFIFRCPDDIKIRCGESKWVLRQYLEKSGLPEIAARRDKRGYPTPIAKWMSGLDLNAIIAEMTSSNHPLAGMIDKEGLNRFAASAKQASFGADHHAYKLVSTYFWAKACL